jgi:hypothetical protein
MSSTTNYKDHQIVPKKDFGGGKGFLIDGHFIKNGFVVTKDGCNAMPGATWFQTTKAAMKAIDDLIVADGDAKIFWELHSARRDYENAFDPKEFLKLKGGDHG